MCCHLWSVRRYYIFPHYLTNGMIFWKKSCNKICVFLFDLHILPETFLILRYASYCHKYSYVSMLSKSCSCHIWIIEFSLQFFEKYSHMTLHRHPSRGSWVFPCGRTNGRTNRQSDMTKLIVTFHNFANAPKYFTPLQRSLNEKAMPRTVYVHSLTLYAALSPLQCSSAMWCDLQKFSERQLCRRHQKPS